MTNHTHRNADQRAAERRQNLAEGEANEVSETRDQVSKTDQAAGSLSISTYRRSFPALTLLIIAGLCAACNRGNGGGISSGTGGWPASSNSAKPAEVSSSAQVVKVSASRVEIVRNGSADAKVSLTISPGYHINANPATFPYLIATQLTPEKAEGIVAGKPVYPAATKQKFQFAEEPLAVFEGDAQIVLPLQADAATAAGTRLLPIKVRVQACDNEKCFPPATLDATVSVEVR